MHVRRYVRWPIMVGAGTAVAAVAAAGFVATSGHSSTHAAKPPPRIVGEGKLSLPLDAYHLSASQAAEEANEGNVIERACMKSYGIPYLTNVPDITAQVSAGFSAADSRRYGVTDLRVAKAYGYHPPSSLMSHHKSARRTHPKLSPQQLFVLTGAHIDDKSSASPFKSRVTKVGSYNGKPVLSGGCVGKADRVLHEPSATKASRKRNMLAANLQQKAYVKTQSQPRVLAVFHKWSACMAEHGLHYPNPISAATNHTWNMKKPPTHREIQTAVTDIKCRSKTDLVDIEYQVETKLQKKLIKHHKSELAPLKKLVAVQIAALHDAIAKYGR